jgi:3-oxoacyl-[acyl-carrier-protein] synthase-3
MSHLRAFGHHVPSRIVTNDELSPLVGESPEWITNACGIEQRRYAAPEETVASLATLAAQKCLANAGLTIDDIGMLLVSSGSPDRFCPGPASAVAAALGLKGALALDVPIASAGSLVALSIAEQFAPRVGRVLVVASEIMSRRVTLTPEGRNTAILFGDGAGACLVDPTIGFLEMKDIHLETENSEILRMENEQLHMDGGSVILQVSRKIPASIKLLLERNHLAAASIGTVLMHQANRNLINKVGTTLGIPVERFFLNIQRYGNTSSASMLIAAAEWRAANTGPVTAPILFAAFGTGLTWGSLLALPSDGRTNPRNA